MIDHERPIPSELIPPEAHEDKDVVEAQVDELDEKDAKFFEVTEDMIISEDPLEKMLPPELPKAVLEQQRIAGENENGNERTRESFAEIKEHPFITKEFTLLQRLRRWQRSLVFIGIFSVVSSVAFASKSSSNSERDIIARDAIASVEKSSVETLRSLDLSPSLSTAHAEDMSEASPDNEETASSVEKQEEERYLQMAKKDPVSTMIDLENISDKPWAKSVLLKIAETDPQIVLGSWSSLEKMFGEHEQEVFEIMLIKDPKNSIGLVGSSEKLQRAMASSTRIEIQALQQIRELDIDYHYKMNASCFIGEIAAGNMTVQEAVDITQDKDIYRKRLIELLLLKTNVADISIRQSLEDVLADILVHTNDLHNESVSTRFAKINSLSPKELYLLLATDSQDPNLLFEPVAFPSTYQGVFDAFIKQLKTNTQDGFDLLKEVEDYNFRAFINTAAQRGRVNDFFDGMSLNNQKKVIEQFFSGLGELQNSPTVAGTAADVLRNLSNPTLEMHVRTILKREFLKASADHDSVGQSIYGLLSILQDESAQCIPENQRKQFRLPDQSKLDVEGLEIDGVIVERYFFYNDKDGRSSFANFLRGFKNKLGWKIEKHKGYVLVSNTRGDRDKKIFANNPSVMPKLDGPVNNEEDFLLDPVGDVLKQQGLKPSIIVHRGHIYHQSNTMKRSPDSVKLFVLGSCGGYAEIDGVILNHPDAQVLSTKGTGTKKVNDTLLRILENKLTNNDVIEWSNFWKTAQKRLKHDRDFKNYVPPDKNFYCIVSARIQEFQQTREQPAS